jgi:hypothetical protein
MSACQFSVDLAQLGEGELSDLVRHPTGHTCFVRSHTTSPAALSCHGEMRRATPRFQIPIGSRSLGGRDSAWDSSEHVLCLPHEGAPRSGGLGCVSGVQVSGYPKHLIGARQSKRWCRLAQHPAVAPRDREAVRRGLGRLCRCKFRPRGTAAGPTMPGPA